MDGNNTVQELNDAILEANVEVGDVVETGGLDLIAKQKEAPDLVDFYAKNYQMYIHTFCNYVDRMPLKSLRRVVKAIAKFPLEVDDFKPQGVGAGKELEKQSFGVGNQVFTAKYMMVSLVKLNEALEEQNKQIKEQGETNG